MEIRSALIHIAVAAIIGAAIAVFSSAKWLAASLWVSSAMLLNGAVATVEDAQHDGVDAPTGAGALAAKCAVAALVLAGLGFAVQFLQWPSP
ncbi:UNVERIFIED_ORG: hypothetical protein LHJ69_11250 [Shinella sp. XGS7]|nr:hypothetical protein [Shinella sp. XGS7]